MHSSAAGTFPCVTRASQGDRSVHILLLLGTTGQDHSEGPRLPTHPAAAGSPHNAVLWLGCFCTGPFEKGSWAFSSRITSINKITSQY